MPGLLALYGALGGDDAVLLGDGDQLELVPGAAQVLRRDGQVFRRHLDAAAAGLGRDTAVAVEPVGRDLRLEGQLLRGALAERLADAAEEVLSLAGLVGGALLGDGLLLGGLDALLGERHTPVGHLAQHFEHRPLLERGDEALDATLAEHAAGVQQPAHLDARHLGLQEGAEAVVGFLLGFLVLREGQLLDGRLDHLAVDAGDGVAECLLAVLPLDARGLALLLHRPGKRGAAGQTHGREAPSLALVGGLDARLQSVELRASLALRGRFGLGEHLVADAAVKRRELADVHDAGAAQSAELVLEHDRLLALLGDLGAVDDRAVGDHAVLVLHALVALGAGGGVLRHSLRFLSLRNWG